MKGMMRFGRRVKLSPRYIGPFEIFQTVGEVAYEFALPPAFSAIHPVFPRDVKRLRSRAIPIVKVRLRHRLIEEATWETEQEMREQFPGLFEPSGTS
ncbi:hypothetical protein MTR67_049843 [Solanum verrucosum]|uniref:Tf2-1-like SH3-like domain-containing protein n=1 Tax=Solanum verrucosum TaxID=315347 RepID=A0AAF0V473_SOLVR|nr:hypothetical protein MTR67_049843 [Solanum verrucosum]